MRAYYAWLQGKKSRPFLIVCVLYLTFLLTYSTTTVWIPMARIGIARAQELGRDLAGHLEQFWQKQIVPALGREEGP